MFLTQERHRYGSEPPRDVEDVWRYLPCDEQELCNSAKTELLSEGRDAAGGLLKPRGMPAHQKLSKMSS